MEKQEEKGLALTPGQHTVRVEKFALLELIEHCTANKKYLLCASRDDAMMAATQLAWRSCDITDVMAIVLEGGRFLVLGDVFPLHDATQDREVLRHRALRKLTPAERIALGVE